MGLGFSPPAGRDFGLRRSKPLSPGEESLCFRFVVSVGYHIEGESRRITKRALAQSKEQVDEVVDELWQMIPEKNWGRKPVRFDYHNKKRLREDYTDGFEGRVG